MQVHNTSNIRNLVIDDTQNNTNPDDVLLSNLKNQEETEHSTNSFPKEIEEAIGALQAQGIKILDGGVDPIAGGRIILEINGQKYTTGYGGLGFDVGGLQLINEDGSHSPASKDVKDLVTNNVEGIKQVGFYFAYNNISDIEDPVSGPPVDNPIGVDPPISIDPPASGDSDEDALAQKGITVIDGGVDPIAGAKITLKIHGKEYTASYGGIGGVAIDTLKASDGSPANQDVMNLVKENNELITQVGMKKSK